MTDDRLVKFWLKETEDGPELATHAEQSTRDFRREALKGIVRRARNGETDAVRWLEEHKLLSFSGVGEH